MIPIPHHDVMPHHNVMSHCDVMPHHNAIPHHNVIFNQSQCCALQCVGVDVDVDVTTAMDLGKNKQTNCNVSHSPGTIIAGYEYCRISEISRISAEYLRPVIVW